jgi:hypothetical protein
MSCWVSPGQFGIKALAELFEVSISLAHLPKAKRSSSESVGLGFTVPLFCAFSVGNGG